MAEITFVTPLAEFAAAVIRSIYEYRDPDVSVETFAQQVQQHSDSLAFLQTSIEERRSRRSRFAHLDDPIEAQLSTLLRDINKTHDATEKFFLQYGITKDAMTPGNSSAPRMGRNMSSKDMIRRKLAELQDNYHFHAVQTSLVSQALRNHTLREFSTAVEANTNLSRARKRLSEPVLLIRPRKMASERVSTYENWVAEQNGLGQPATEVQFRAPAVVEDILRTQVQDESTESQHRLFARFKKELLESNTEGIQGFDLPDLLNKIVFWLSQCDAVWSHDEILYSLNYVQLMKAAWLLSETMKHIPTNRTSNALNESYLIEIQNTIIAMHPTGRGPLEMWALDRLREDAFLLKLTDQVETRMPAVPVERESQDSHEFVAFEKTVPYPPYDDHQRLVRVLRHKDNFTENPVVSRGLDDTISILEETSWIQRDGTLVNTRLEDNKYSKLQTLFTPAFCSSKFGPTINSLAGRNPDEIVHIRKFGDDIRNVAQKSFPFYKTADIEDFQHAITGYLVKSAADAGASQLKWCGRFGRRKTTDMQNTFTQIWCPEPLITPGQRRSESLYPSRPPTIRGINRRPVPGRSTPMLGSPELPGSPRSGFPPSIFEVGMGLTSDGSQYSGETGVTRGSRLPTRVNYLKEPEPAKLLIYGQVKGDEYMKHLAILSLDERIDLNQDCCAERKTPGDQIMSCCENVSICWDPKAGKGEVTLFTTESNDITIGGNWKRNRETARIALPVDVEAWPSAGKRLNFERIFIQFGTISDKVAFVQSFRGRRGLFLSNRDDFEEAAMERRKRHMSRKQ